MPAAGIQDKIFSQVKGRLKPGDSLVEKIAEILAVSTDSAYRRIRGETALVIEEAVTLCGAFGLSLDQVSALSGKDILFRNVHISEQSLTYRDYLESLYSQLQQLGKYTNKEIVYMSKDLPIFHNFYYRPLIAFRYFFWMKTHLAQPGFENLKFSFDLLPPEIEELSRSITQAYCQIPSTEMWNTESVNSTISQIEFSRDSGHFSNEKDIRIIYESLEQSIQHVQLQAEWGRKLMPGGALGPDEPGFRFFNNRVVLGDNTIMVIADEIITVYINYGHLNYLQTQDPVFCRQLSRDFDNLIKRSTLISQTGERQRNVFFHILLQKIKARQQNLSS